MLGLTSVPYRFFLIPVRQSGPAEEELNGFLRSHRVLNVDRQWVDEGSESFWSFCVDYLETGQDGRAAQGGASERGKVDYREVLSPEQFALFGRAQRGHCYSWRKARECRTNANLPTPPIQPRAIAMSALASPQCPLWLPLLSMS